MSLFCLLWTPLFFLFRKAVVADGNISSGGVWAILLGSIAAVARFFLGSLVNPGGFGLSRWLNACVDIVSLPALLPLVVYFLFIPLRIVSGSAGFANFALLWLIPEGVLRAISQGPQRDPSLLVLVPLLWTAVVTGIPFFIRILPYAHIPVIILALVGILLLPFLAATVYWAFFSQKYLPGSLLLLAAVIPMGISLYHGAFKS
ncbi:MAG: DUF5412 domain-containing protein [Treponema sp.]|jgi:hypothetical protein|nr:DUF5412 domain-containing protein [Treponema sp.]